MTPANQGTREMEKQTYRVSDGVEWINGARVPADRLVQLNEAEARYDRALGRLTLEVASETETATSDKTAKSTSTKKAATASTETAAEDTGE